MTALTTEATPVVLNLPLAEAVLEQITAHPELHDQGNYGVVEDCGTVHCTAGWAAELSPDAEIRWRNGELITVHIPEYGWMGPFRAGAILLGITIGQADKLFLGLDEQDAVAYLRELIAAAKQATS